MSAWKVSAKANLGAAQVKAALAAGRSQNFPG